MYAWVQWQLELASIDDEVYDVGTVPAPPDSIRFVGLDKDPDHTWLMVRGLQNKGIAMVSYSRQERILWITAKLCPNMGGEIAFIALWHDTRYQIK
jgi:hypothetical protein